MNRRLRRKRDHGRAAALFLAPAAIGFAVFYLYPSAKGVWYPLTDWNLLSEERNPWPVSR